MIKIVQLITILIVNTVFLNNCCLTSGQTNVGNQSEVNSNRIETPEQMTAMCSKLAGEWKIYHNRKGEGKKNCGDRPCGFKFASNFLLTCKNDILSGIALKGTDTTVSPPKISYIEISSSIKDGNLTFSYSYICSFEYKITEIEDNRFFGEFLAKDCIKNLLPYNEGDLVALRVIREKNK